MRKLLLASMAALGLSSGMAEAAYLSTVPAATTTPGTLTVRLNGRFVWYAGVAGSSLDNVNGGKLAPQTMQGYIRLYPGFEGVLQNGMKYGALLEFRQNFASPVGASVGGNTTQSTLFVRRATGYIGSDQLGTFRFGQTDGPATLFLTGTFEGFDDGGWNGDLPAFLPGNAQPAYPFPSQSALYGSDKVVYLSPSFYGFDFGVSYAPNTSALQNNGGGCATGGLAGGCDRQTSSLAASDIGRRTNMVEAQVRYRGTFSGVGLAVAGGYIGAGVVQNGGNPLVGQFKHQDILNLGATISFGGFSFGGNAQTGSYNGGSFGAKQAGLPNATAWIAGAQYQTGPITVGAHYFKNYTGGSAASTTGMRNEGGVAVGSTYQLTPGVSLFASYIYGNRHETGLDFATGLPGSAHNNVQGQAFAVGTLMNW
ncbi:porin [Limobrevibacterium gyesilva]|uniref:Porin n=1 Tax=Limobrevibacterium gyesilva TaxID=2991712 RepID=A0AA41YJD1_9PROT|nr:porin [Limobrevibacterium gyesilva]MCW3473640.1 porin [Limobrevibacterium gyesilva]